MVGLGVALGTLGALGRVRGGTGSTGKGPGQHWEHWWGPQGPLKCWCGDLGWDWVLLGALGGARDALWGYWEHLCAPRSHACPLTRVLRTRVSLYVFPGNTRVPVHVS